MATALVGAFIDTVDSKEPAAYRKGSFRARYSSDSSGHAQMRAVGAKMRLIEGPPAPPGKLPASHSEETLTRLAQKDAGQRRFSLGISAVNIDDDEPHLAVSPFRLRPRRRYSKPFMEAADEGHWKKSDDCGAELMHLGRSSSSDLLNLASLRRTGSDLYLYLSPADEASLSRRMTVVFAAIWYLTGAFTNSSSKLALASLPVSLPLTLTLVQHLTATACGSVVCRLLRLQPYRPLPTASETSDQAWRSLGWLCAVYTLGFALTNASFGAVNASFVDTVKAAEPISTVVLAHALLPQEQLTARVLVALLPIVGGVAISSMAEASASLVGLAFALGSNFCFSARSIAAKLVGQQMGEARMDGANLFVHVNRLGLLVLLPAVLLFESAQLRALCVELSAERLTASLRLFAFNGLMYYLNNQMNFLVLEKVDTLTHGIINCGRRVANILFAIMWFGNRVNSFNAAGISLAVAGGFMYVRAKMLDSAKPKSSKAA